MDIQEKFLLQNHVAYMLVENNGEYKLVNQAGTIMPYEQMLEVAQKLTDYANKHRYEIAVINERIAAKYDEWWRNIISQRKEKAMRCLYLFKSNNRYKIGCTKDIGRRLKELNNRPFSVEVVCCSKPNQRAFKEERKLHEMLKTFKIGGEWYELPQEILEEVILKINSI